MTHTNLESKSYGNHRVWLRVLLSITVAVTLLASAGAFGEAWAGPDTHPPPPPGGGGPNHVFLTIRVFYGVGVVKLNGSTYTNGQVATLQSGIPVSLSVSSLDGGYSFSDWESDVGNFTSATSSSTTFTPFNSEAAGTLALIPQDTWQSGQSWAGYIVDNNDESISCTGGVYYNVPPTTYVGNGWPTVDINSIWVGIGGDQGNTSLWQAGILVWYTGNVGGGGNQLYWQPFTETVTSSGGGTEWVGSSSSDFPSALTISVCTNNGQDTAQIEAYYANTGHSTWWNETSNNFWPDRNTGEWIVEDPIYQGNRVPLGAFAPFGVEYPSWTDNGRSYYEFLGPLTYLSLTDTAYGTQYVTPGSITTGYGQFPISYST